EIGGSFPLPQPRAQAGKHGSGMAFELRQVTPLRLGDGLLKRAVSRLEVAHGKLSVPKDRKEPALNQEEAAESLSRDTLPQLLDERRIRAAQNPDHTYEVNGREAVDRSLHLTDDALKLGERPVRILEESKA